LSKISDEDDDPEARKSSFVVRGPALIAQCCDVFWQSVRQGARRARRPHSRIHRLSSATVVTPATTSTAKHHSVTVCMKLSSLSVVTVVSNEEARVCFK